PQALEMARGADVMVHETTLEQAMAEKANSRGHSSSQQTAALAKEAGVGTLIATHFSSRYDAEGCLRMLAECQEIFPNTLLAEDFMVYKMA
ncbi:ribonuclease Z, partial [Klebsiella pneumoniae]